MDGEQAMKVMIVTISRFPEQNALTTHITLVSKLFLEAGNDVYVCSRSISKFGEHEGIPFKSVKSKSRAKLFDFLDHCYRFSKRIIKEINECKPDIVLAYGIPEGLLKKMIKKSKKGDFMLFYDCVEWYSKDQFKAYKPEIIFYYKCDYIMRKLLPGNSFIIAISQYLKKYFEAKGNSCLYLPALCDVQAVHCEKHVNNEKVIITYAGSPGKKELFEPVVKAVSELLPEERNHLSIKIIGSNAQAIAVNANVSVDFIDSISDVIEFLPRMPHEEVLKQLENSDFTILIRPSEKRYAKAGFPTKVPESLSTGTPIICNFSSDLDMYLEDGVNAIIADGYSTEDVKAAFRKALSLTYEEREQMYKNARKTAEEKFDYRLYVGEMKNFLENSYNESKKKNER